MRARVHDERAADGDRRRQPVVGMPAQDHVDAAHAAGHLHVGRQPVVAQEHDDVDLLDVAELVDEPLRLRVLDAEREPRDEARRVRDRHVGECLADHAHRDAAHVLDRVRREDRLVPVQLARVVADEVALKQAAAVLVAEQLLHPLEPMGELPVRREDLDAELVHDPHHVEAARPERRRRALERVAAVEEERPARPRVPDALDQRRQVRVAPHPAIARGERLEVQVAQRIRFGRSARDPIGAQERLARQERRLARLVAHPDQRIRLSVVDGVERGVRIGHVEQGDVAEVLEVEQALRLELLRQRARGERAEAARHGDQREEVAARDVHGATASSRGRAPGPPAARTGHP